MTDSLSRTFMAEGPISPASCSQSQVSGQVTVGKRGLVAPVSAEYSSKFEFTGGRIIKVIFDVSGNAYVKHGASPGGSDAAGLTTLCPVEL